MKLLDIQNVSWADRDKKLLHGSAIIEDMSETWPLLFQTDTIRL